MRPDKRTDLKLEDRLMQGDDGDQPEVGEGAEPIRVHYEYEVASGVTAVREACHSSEEDFTDEGRCTICQTSVTEWRAR